MKCDDHLSDADLQQAALFVLCVVKCTSTKAINFKDNQKNASLHSFLSSQKSWRDVITCEATVNDGPYMGVTVVGTGWNVRSRTRVTYLALAMAVLCDLPEHEHWPHLQGYPASFRELVDAARQLKTKTEFGGGAGSHGLTAQGVPLPVPARAATSATQVISC